MSESEKSIRRKVLKENKNAKKNIAKAIKALYGKVREYQLIDSSPINNLQGKGAPVQSPLKTLSFITDYKHSTCPTAGQWLVNGVPLLEEDCHFSHNKTEMSFSKVIRGQLIKAHLIFHKQGLEIAGLVSCNKNSFSAQYRIKPQTYKLDIAKGGAYVDSNSGLLMWDRNSDRWKDADWSSYPEGLEFTFGVKQEEISYQQYSDVFTCSFRDPAEPEDTWTPPDNSGTVSTVDGLLMVNFEANEDDLEYVHIFNELAPYKMRLQFDIFATECWGAVTFEPEPKGNTANAVTGVWIPSKVCGTYQLNTLKQALVAHNQQISIDQTPLETGTWHNSVFSWKSLPKALKNSGLPEEGSITFSKCGDEIEKTSFGTSGKRINSQEAVKAGLLKNDQTSQNSQELDITDLKRMTQFSSNGQGYLYDEVQQLSMSDFYSTLGYYMDDEDCKKFFNPNPAPLSPEVKSIATIPGVDGTTPETFYQSLSVPYTVSSIVGAQMNDSDYLNGVRARRWIGNQTTVSDVMDAQSSAFYNRQFRIKNSNISKYIQDQIKNAKNYEENITEDTKARIKITTSELAPGDDEGKKLITDNFKEIEAHTKKNKCYWAFVMYGYYTHPAFLNVMQTLVADSSALGSGYTEELNRGMALLNALDNTGFFAQQLVEVLRAFNLSVLLPQIMDYESLSDDFHYAVDRIFKKFVEEYIDSTDPEMQEAAKMLKKEGSQETIDNLIMLMSQISITHSGLYNWKLFSAKYEKTYQKVFSSLPRGLCKFFLTAVASYTMVLLLTGGIPWSDLSTKEKVTLIGSATVMFSQGVWAIVNRGLKVPLMFENKVGFWKRFGAFFKTPKGGGKILEHEISQMKGLKGWMMGKDRKVVGKQAINAMNESFASGAEAIGKKELSTTKKIFGRNLNEFMATRVGAFLAAAGIVFSAVSLAHADSGLEKAFDSLFLVASIFEFFATAGAWLLDAVAIEFIGGFAVSSLCTIASAIGGAALVGGIILICIFMFKPKDSPAKAFAKSTGKAYYKPYKYDIDDMQQYMPLDEKQRVGVSLSSSKGDSSVMHIELDGKVSSGPFDHTGATAFYLYCNEFGYAQFGAPLLNEEDYISMKILGIDDEGKIVASAANKSEEAVMMQQWITDTKEDAVYQKTEDEQHVKQGVFTFYNRYLYIKTGVKKYLTYGENGWKVSSSSQKIYVTMQSTQPQGLSMADVNWYNDQFNLVRFPSLMISGSQPISWSIEPKLPDYLEFNEEVGRLAMKTGEDMKVFDKSKFTIWADNKLAKLSCDFYLQILPAIK